MVPWSSTTGTAGAGPVLRPVHDDLPGRGLLVILASVTFIEEDKHQPEYYSLILLATVGMMVVASATDLFVLFVGIEVTSMSSYALVAFRKKDVKGAEAATKYFIIGGLSSGLHPVRHIPDLRCHRTRPLRRNRDAVIMQL